ncbi:MAG: rod shape-determining protein MreC, partial [Verrucomicrobiota bacterium]
MLKRPHYIALCVVVVLVLILLGLPDKTAAQLKLALGGFSFVPLFGLASSSQRAVEKAGNAIIPRQTLVQELERLRIENEQLRLHSMQTTQIWHENAQLRQAFAWQKHSTWKLRPARVLLRDPANWWRTLSIDIGSREGVVTNLPVLTAEGLIGRISDVALTRSTVVLIGDPNCRVSALVEKTRDHGVITAGTSTVLDSQLVDLTFLPRHSQIQPGQKVVTSGLGGIFPAGITIGHIVDIRTVDFGVYLEARVKLAADLNHLEHVWV